MSDRKLASRKVRRMQTTSGRQAETPAARRARIVALTVEARRSLSRGR